MDQVIQLTVREVLVLVLGLFFVSTVIGFELGLKAQKQEEASTETGARNIYYMSYHSHRQKEAPNDPQ